MDEKINYRAIGILATIWLLLGYLLWLPAPGEHSGPVGTSITRGLPVRQIVGVSISTPDGRSVRYLKRAGRWLLLEPYRVAGNESMLSELLEAVGNTRIMEIVEKQPEKLSLYGLAEAQRMTVALVFEDGTVQTFRIGARLPLNQIYVYFQREGEASVFRAWEGIRLILEKYAAVLDQGRPVRFDPARIGSLEVVRGEQALHLEKREGNWLITRPLQRAAASQAVQSYLESILALTSGGVYQADAISGKKLSDPGNLRLILDDDKGKETMVLHLAGKDSTSPALLRLEQDGQSTIYTTDAGAMDRLAVDPDDFSLARALFFAGDEITGIEVSHPQYSLGIFREPDGSWTFRHPYEGQRADADTVGQLLHLLGSMDVKEYLEKGSGTGDSPEETIGIELADKTGFMTLKIARSPEGFYRGTSALHPKWYRLEADKVKRLAAFAPEALVDRHLLVFDPRAVVQVIVQRKDNNYVLRKQGSGWEWEKPQKKKAKNGVAWKLVFSLRDLQYLKPAEENRASPAGIADCGNHDPDILIRVLQAGAEPVGEIRMKASKPGNEMLVSSSRLTGCYLIGRTTVDELLPDPSILADHR